MEEYRASKISSSISVYRVLLDEYASDDCKKRQILCNIAAMEQELGLHRKCIRTCDEAMSISTATAQFTPHYIKAKALAALHKNQDALEVCREALMVCDDFSDVLLMQMLQQLVVSLQENASPASLPPRSATEKSDSSQQRPSPCLPPASSPALAKATHPSSSGPNKALLPTLTALQNQFVGDHEKIHPDFMAQARISLAHATHDPLVDNIIIIAYMLVNSNQLDGATKIFTFLLQYDASIVAAWIGLGSVQAMERQLQDACFSFTTAISLDPTVADAWKRRGQTRGALGHYSEALNDFDQAFRLNSGDNDIYYQRGVVYHMQAQYAKALAQFQHVSAESSADSKLHLMIGMCQAQLGNIVESFAAYEEALRIDSQNIDAVVNYGLILKEYGRYADAEKQLLTALKLDPKRISALNILLSLYYLLAKPKRVIIASEMIPFNAIALLTDQMNYLANQALALHITGQFSRSMQIFNHMLQLDKTSYRRIQRDVMLYNVAHIDTPLTMFNIDADFAAEAKYAWCQKAALSNALIVTSSCLLESIDHTTILLKADIPSLETTELSEKQCAILRFAAVLSPWIQLRSPGFLPNRRQHRIFGLSSIHLSQILREHVGMLAENGAGVQSRNAGASLAMGADPHPLSYRDWMDVLVKYRQVSEPDDAVWWIDRMPPQHFAEGFGLHTPVVNGELKCIRYYTYCDRGIELVKTHMHSGYYNSRNVYKTVSQSQLQKLGACTTLDALYDIIGEDFYVITACKSYDTKTTHEGTRLTLLKTLSGFDFSIRTASTPERWQAMHREMALAFDRIVSTLSHADCPATVLKHALEYFYYWVHFAPLSRGSAFCGYVALTATLLAAGYVILSPIPVGMQMDWEAIFEPRVEVFVSRMMKWIIVDKSCFDVDEVKVSECVETLRDLYFLISVGTE